MSHIKPIKDKSPNYGGVKNTGLSPEGVLSEVVNAMVCSPEEVVLEVVESLIRSPPGGSGYRGC